jgi:excisionase family DNA binding protein
MGKILTTHQISKYLNISARRIRALAKSRNVGTQLPGGTWIFRKADIKKLEERKPGRPPKQL